MTGKCIQPSTRIHNHPTQMWLWACGCLRIMQHFMMTVACANHTVMKTRWAFGFLAAMVCVTQQMTCPFLRYGYGFVGVLVAGMITPCIPSQQADPRCKANVSEAIQPMEPEHKFHKTDEFRNVVHITDT